MRVYEGTVDEIVEYERRIGGRSVAATAVEDLPTDDPGTAYAVAGGMDDSDEYTFYIRQHVYGRSRTAGSAHRVLRFLEAVASKDTVIEIGESERTADGWTDYLMVRASGPRKFGAVAYVRPANGGVNLRLKDTDVLDLDGNERVRLRNVQAQSQYAVDCPLTDEGAVELALDLVDRALAKVRQSD